MSARPGVAQAPHWHLKPIRDEHWRERAACARTEVDSELFFPGKSAPQSRIDQARLVCLSCPVRYECLQSALDHNEVGIWGGTTDAQRSELKRWRKKEGA